VDHQAKGRQAFDDRRLPAPELAFAVAEQGEIVHVPQVRPAAEFTLDEQIEGVEIDVGPELRGQIADRQPPGPAGRQQVVPREPDPIVFVAQHVPPARHDRLDQPHEVVFGNPTTQDLQQDRVIDGREVLADIGAQHVAISPGEGLETVYRTMCPLTDPVGVAVGDEQAFETGFDDSAQGVMYDTVGEASRADLSALGFVDDEMRVRARPVAPLEQARPQRQQAIGELMLEGRDGPVTPFGARGSGVGRQQVRPAAEFAERCAMHGRR
jgi:hypothetical protein